MKTTVSWAFSRTGMKLPRLYPILDTGTLARRGLALETAVSVMLEAGVGILQLRHKEHFSRALFETAERIAVCCRLAGVPFVVNDRADIARLLGAGLHLGQEDLPVSAARQILGDQAALGFSTHNEEQLRNAPAEASYLAMGPIFATGTKENLDPVVGLQSLRKWRALTAKPLVAIGGITLDNAREVIAAGADSVAVVNALYPDPLTPAGLRERIQQWNNALA